jgi:hypothetical protein
LGLFAGIPNSPTPARFSLWGGSQISQRNSLPFTLRLGAYTEAGRTV